MPAVKPPRNEFLRRRFKGDQRVILNRERLIAENEKWLRHELAHGNIQCAEMLADGILAMVGL